MKLRLKCIHCGHEVDAETCSAADRQMSEHYRGSHPHRQYATELELTLQEAHETGRMSDNDYLNFEQRLKS